MPGSRWSRGETHELGAVGDVLCGEFQRIRSLSAVLPRLDERSPGLRRARHRRRLVSGHDGAHRRWPAVGPIRGSPRRRTPRAPHPERGLGRRFRAVCVRAVAHRRLVCCARVWLPLCADAFDRRRDRRARGSTARLLVWPAAHGRITFVPSGDPGGRRVAGARADGRRLLDLAGLPVRDGRRGSLRAARRGAHRERRRAASVVAALVAIEVVRRPVGLLRVHSGESRGLLPTVDGSLGRARHRHVDRSRALGRRRAR